MVTAQNIIAIVVSTLAMLAILFGVYKAIKQFCNHLKLDRMNHQYREVFDQAANAEQGAGQHFANRANVQESSF
ncbi:hypothetical protein CAEBREN_17033 [Caenorhabditis brenneri]|uniref:Uncharacterized protein n=1 Tax=Caenorhabditis brenneri TaxID=135651 RepID=G0NPC0_CAEBE|nr:hypothetical protein CAEBREN_17033 [Caenorhabditis brenneri]